MKSRKSLVLGLLGLGIAGCAALPLNTANNLLPKLAQGDPAASPSIDQTPESATGGWQATVGVPPSVSTPPTPTPRPPLQILPDEGYTGIYFEFPDGLSARVGSHLRVKLTPEETKAPVTMGVLDPTKGRIEADGSLTILSPGPVFAYAEQNGLRSYFLAAGLPDTPLPVATQPGLSPGSFEGASWATFLQSPQDWQTFWNPERTAVWERMESPPAPPPLPQVDFATQVILAINTGLMSDGENEPVLTQLGTGASPTIQLVFPNSNPPAGFGEEYALCLIYVLPKPATLPAWIATARLHPNEALNIPVLSPAGPSPSPSPTPLPVPTFTRSPGGKPPFPPPVPPPN
ncbi:MAG TPA: hypothetical protein V6D47_18965 [Oscillatoriaceae cyanobacterium]